MYERHTYDEMSYLLPTKPGKLTLILKFAEVLILLARCILRMQENVYSTLKLELKL